MFYLDSMALNPVPVPILQQPDEKELPEDIDTVHKHIYLALLEKFKWLSNELRL